MMKAKCHADSAPSRTSAVQDADPAGSDDLVLLADSTSDPFTPEMVLFIDDTEESRLARQLLVEHGEAFRTLSANGQRVPAVVFGGIVAERLVGVQGLLRALSAFDTAVEVGMIGQPLRPLPRTE